MQEQASFFQKKKTKEFWDIFFNLFQRSLFNRKYNLSSSIYAFNIQDLIILFQ